MAGHVLELGLGQPLLEIEQLQPQRRLIRRRHRARGQDIPLLLHRLDALQQFRIAAEHRGRFFIRRPRADGLKLGGGHGIGKTGHPLHQQIGAIIFQAERAMGLQKLGDLLVLGPHIRQHFFTLRGEGVEGELPLVFLEGLVSLHDRSHDCLGLDGRGGGE